MNEPEKRQIDDGQPLVIGSDVILGQRQPIDPRLAFNTLADAEFAAAANELGLESGGDDPSNAVYTDQIEAVRFTDSSAGVSDTQENQ